MSRTSNTAHRRDQIADACKTLLAERGYEGTTTIDIAKRAGLAPGLVHYHFASKEAILVAVTERVAQALLQRVEARQAEAATSPEARLRAILDAHVALGPDADPAGVAAWNVIVDEAMRRPDVKLAVDRVLEADAQLIRTAVSAVLGAQGSRANEITGALLAAVHGYWQLSRLDPRLVPPGSAQAGLRAMADGLMHARTDAQGVVS